jgi:hypothetical protein
MIIRILKRSFTAFLFLLVATCIHAQDRIVPVFANAEKGDSLYLAIEELFTGLRKAVNVDYTIAPPSSFKGNGFLILTTPAAGKLGKKFPANLKKYGPEGIYINGDSRGVTMIGNTNLALRQAMFLYLEQLGFSSLLPGEIWQHVPKLNTVYKTVNVLTQPDFMLRTIANGHGFGGNKKLEQDFYDWSSANRLGGSFVARVGHAYDEIVTANQQVFKEHPEYFAQPVSKGTIPETPKFNVANKDLVQLVINDAFRRIELYKKAGWNPSMVSMEPSDGGGFCTSEACKAIGSISDQVFYLSNAVARALQQKYPGTMVGGFAYSEHILPTKYKLEPNVYVMVTNGFNRTKYSTADLLKLWGKKASQIGIYDYNSVYEWDNDLPGQVAVAKIASTQKAVRIFYNSGARSYIGESIMGWINKGPAQYILAKLLWNINTDVVKTRNEFFDKAYGNAAAPMKKLYDSWENYPHRIVLDNDLADWMSWVQEAWNQAGSELIRKRIDQVKLYLHYVVLYRDLKKNPTEDNMLRVLSFAYRNYENAPFATLPTLVSLPSYIGYKQMGWYAAPEQKWKADKRPYSTQEIQSVFQQDMRSIVRGPAVKKYVHTNSFVKLGSVTSIPERKFYTSKNTFEGRTEFIIRINNKSAGNKFDIYSGIAATPPDDRSVVIRVYPVKNNVVDDEQPILRFEQIKRKELQEFSLASLAPGMYRVVVDDLKKVFVLSFSKGIDYSIVMKPDEKIQTTSSAGLNIFYFYVPKGVRNFRVNKSVVLVLESPTRRLIKHENNKEETIEVNVLPGEEGIWGIGNQAGHLYLEGVPPYLGNHPAQMLVPSYLAK